MDDPPPLFPLPFSIDESLSRDTTQGLPKLPNNLLYNSTVPLSFETYPEYIYTIPHILNT